jgi:PAS domain S-box-containing protein
MSQRKSSGRSKTETRSFVDERARAQADIDKRLRQAEERFRLFMENVKEYAIFMLDPSGRVVDWNVGAEHVLGYGSEILGQPFGVFFPSDDRNKGVPERELTRAAETGQCSDDRWHVRKNGSYFWAFGITTAMRDENGTLKGFAKILRDSTERKRFEEQLDEKNKALQQADRQKDEFLAMLAHELRNPLAPIFNAVSVLQHEKIDSDVGRQAIAIVNRQARSLGRLVDDLLEVSRVTTGKIELRKQLVDLNDIVNNAVLACRSALDGRKHHLELSLSPERLWVHADATRIEQVVTNLLNNAAKYTPDGGAISLTASREADRAILRVVDTGVGIPAEFLPRVFDMFAQGDHTLSRAQGGLGIGLTLVQKLVEMHGGSVQANSKGPGEGSQFAVSLPIQDKLEHVDSNAASETGQRSQKPLSIVIVDDNRDAAESLSMVLTLDGHDVRTANDARKGIQLAEEHQPDVMFIDIGMPGMNGFDMAEQLSKNARDVGMTLVALTGYGAEDARKRGKQAGFAHFLVKPVEAQAVYEVLASISKN